MLVLKLIHVSEREPNMLLRFDRKKMANLITKLPVMYYDTSFWEKHRHAAVRSMACYWHKRGFKCEQNQRRCDRVPEMWVGYLHRQGHSCKSMA